MPFKLKLKKSRHYSVVSKSLFVICVEILDCTNIECTLSSESTGQDCLDIVCQKLGLNQPKFFGLQYMSRNSDNTLYWLELDRPLKRQLDKYASGLNVYLRVMYYVISGVRLISDEVTRNHYFLQLKTDVIDEKIPCTPQQAVGLASYAMQAEFGNFDAERHTSLYLKDFQLFPKSFTDPGLLETLTEAAIRQHASLHNLPQGTAEEYYICACQQLEGYGQEIYAVKDRLGDDANISVSLTEVSVGYAGKKERRHYGWIDIKNVINHKRDFTIETVDGAKVEFQFHDVESAKNAWRFCVLQHTFYRQYEMNGEQNESRSLPPPPPPVFQQAHFEEKLRQIDSYEDITDHWDPSASTQNLRQRAQSTSCLDLNSKTTNAEHLRSLLPTYRPAPDYETAMQNKYRNSTPTTAPSSGIVREPTVRNVRNILYSSQPEIHQTQLRFPDVVTHHNLDKSLLFGSHQHQQQLQQQNLLHFYKPPPPYPSNRISSNSTPDLAGNQQYKPRLNFLTNNIVSGSSPDLVSGNLYLKHYSQMIYPQHQPVHRSHSFLPQHTQNTYENLSMFNNNLLRPQALIVENPNVTKHIKKVYDEHGNIIYCMPANMNEILKENQLPNTGFVVNALVPHELASSNEPIYENIPLPWQNNADNDSEMRARTQSIHSAPEVINHAVVNAIQNQLKNTNLNDDGDDASLYANLTRHNSNKSRSETAEEANLSSMSAMQKPVMNSTVTSASIYESSSRDTTRDTSGTTEFSSTTSNSSSSLGGKQKKKRWGILIGRSKSTEKVKSATLGREKEKKEKHNVGNNKHRWSTGLPRFNPLPPSISKETMCQLLENKVSDSQLFVDFDAIAKKKANADFKTASHPDNAQFNRYKDVLPYEDNRLRLTPSKKNRMGYINASHITATVGSRQRFYIAAQGPDRATLPYFWQCVWEAEVYLVVQLTDGSESVDYMPDSKERCVDVSQEYQVWWEFSQNSGNCVTSKVRLCHVSSRRYRTLWHMHYTDWGDQGCPKSVGHFLGFLEEMQSVQQHSMDEIPVGHNKNPPVLVHCTAGVGRTGLTILADLLLYTVDHNQEVCIQRAVELLRHQRAYMIQTVAQYRFVYLLLIHYLKQTRLI